MDESAENIPRNAQAPWRNVQLGLSVVVILFHPRVEQDPALLGTSVRIETSFILLPHPVNQRSIMTFNEE